ncbi:hypothetical protein ACP70R_044144 [Stipagrostis hirtigluma subsp. patula]
MEADVAEGEDLHLVGFPEDDAKWSLITLVLILLLSGLSGQSCSAEHLWGGLCGLSISYFVWFPATCACCLCEIVKHLRHNGPSFSHT